MNKLPLAKRVQILSMLVEGASMRAVSRVADVSINTVTKLLESAGEACIALHDEKVRNVPSKRVQCDEIWSFNYCKRVNVEKAKAAPEGAGDVWTWTALDSDSKMIVSYYVGSREGESAREFMQDLSDRLANRIQLTTDGYAPYRNAVDLTFGNNVDFAQLVKVYSASPGGAGPERKYSPGVCVGARKVAVYGLPDGAHVSTSHVESHNQKMRASMRRFTRLTAAHSKKLANHCHMLAIYFAFYNFVKVHTTLRMSPAMAAGVETKLWSMTDIVNYMDAIEPAPAKRGPYKKQAEISK